ncbi:M48 family metalloprotease [Amaricoccus macauensis]|uniref:M48 family metalloprotease n=1 Tax=Amaricoccus macauensis TaxID=57001 RepID=UPI003C7BCF4E
MRHFCLILGLVGLAACSTTYDVPVAPSGAQTGASSVASGGASRSPADFNRVKRRVEPVAETVCREEAPSAPASYCDFRIIFETDPDLPPNAFQTIGEDGRPVLVMTSTLLREMRSDDEIAFVLSHEAAHHVAEHLTKQQQSQILGAMVAGGLAAALGGDLATEKAVRDAMDVGAFVGARAYSQSYEYEADWVGAFIAARAGYNPERGSQVFGRPALASGGGPVLLSTHPASPRRLQLVSAAAQEIERQKAAGLTPRPDYASR